MADYAIERLGRLPVSDLPRGTQLEGAEPSV